MKKEKMSWEEMKKQYPNEWLLIVDFDTDESGRLLAGIVERHGRDMGKVAQPPALNKPTALRYTGESSFMGLRRHVKYDHSL